MSRLIRVGIDVGGTHTKAVAIDNTTQTIVGKASVMTTHHSEKGVAEGVIKAFQKCLEEHRIDPKEVVFIAHSTTQATNALLEGDVAKVGVLGIGKGLIEGFLTDRQTRIKDIDLGTGKFIRTCHSYMKKSQLNDNNIKATLTKLMGEGANVIVASKAFGVDKMDEEALVQEVAEREFGLQCTAASEITKLYGLTTRTRTATVNASILPKMLDTASCTESSVKEAGIQVPLMIMRGDGGVMEVSEMKKRPVLTMLSGPAASVIGALMYLRASNGIYFEVGGTSTNIGVIKNGRPTVDYSIIGGHRTYVNSLDVRVLGVAGGSMIRVKNGELVDVGPRSAHIAGASYAAFTPEEELEGAQVCFLKPKADDPDDYVGLRLKNGKLITITNTCAANVLKLVKPGDFAYGNYNSCCKAMQPVAELLGLTIEETAQKILAKACDKIIPVIRELAAKYKLEEEQMVLVGVGGGACSLLPFTANAMNLKYSVPENAEVISSIGVAMAMIREMVERVEPNPTPEIIMELKKEARQMAINSGALPDTIEVFIEINPQAQKIAAIALGSTEAQASDIMTQCTLEEAGQIAADSMNVPASEIQVEAYTDKMFVFGKEHNGRTQIRVVDKKGFIKIQRRDAVVAKCISEEVADTLKSIWTKSCAFNSDIMMIPDVYVVVGSRVLDYSGMTKLEPLKELLMTEVQAAQEDDMELIIIGAKNDA